MMSDVIQLLNDYASGGAVVDGGLISRVESHIERLEQRLMEAEARYHCPTCGGLTIHGDEPLCMCRAELNTFVRRVDDE